MHAFLRAKKDHSLGSAGVLSSITSLIILPFRLILVIFRFFVLGLLCLWLFAMLGLAPLMLYSWPLLRRIWRRYASLLGLRMALLLSGVWWIRVRRCDSQGRTLPTATLFRRMFVDPLFRDGAADSGALVLSNSVGPLERIALAALLDPVFTRVPGWPHAASIPNAPPAPLLGGLVQRRSLLFAVWDSIARVIKLCEEDDVEGGTMQPLTELCRLAKKQRLGPVAVFPEAATSNGEVLLQWQPVLRGLPASPDIPVHLVCFSVSPWATYHPGAGPLLAIFRILYHWSTSMDISFVSVDRLPQIPSPGIPVVPMFVDGDSPASNNMQDSASLSKKPSMKERERLRRRNVGQQTPDPSTPEPPTPDLAHVGSTSSPPSSSTSSSSSWSAMEWPEHARSCMASVLKVLPVSLGVRDKLAFETKWREK